MHIKRELNRNTHHYYCSACGATCGSWERKCRLCDNVLAPMLISEHPWPYYGQKSEEKYGDPTHWGEFLLEEARKNPYFDEERFQERIKRSNGCLM